MANMLINSRSGYIRLNQILQVIPVCKATWWNGVNSGRYPKPVKISARCTAWRVEEIKELVDAINSQQLN